MKIQKIAVSGGLAAGFVMAALFVATPVTLFAAGTADAATTAEAFSSPDKAAKALVDANKAGTDQGLLAVLGPEARDLISSGDAVADKEGRQKFVAAYTARHKWESDGKDRKILVVGENGWPLPVPLVETDGQWRFDPAAGRQEILQRRIGHNELRVMKICRAYVEAQREYAAEQPAGKTAGTLRKFEGETDQQYAAEVLKAQGKREYAQRFLSSHGKHDGLYWQVKPGEKESPFGPLVAEAEEEGYMAKGAKHHSPYHGYYYHVLKAQGPDAPGGAKDYVSRGRMTGGFALIAYPAKYGDSGLRSFVVNQAGIVFEKDLGPNTVSVAAKIKKYDPDKTWSVAEAPTVDAKSR